MNKRFAAQKQVDFAHVVLAVINDLAKEVEFHIALLIGQSQTLRAHGTAQVTYAGGLDVQLKRKIR